MSDDLVRNILIGVLVVLLAIAGLTFGLLHASSTPSSTVPTVCAAQSCPQ